MSDFNEIVEIWDNQPNQNALDASQIIKEARKIKEKIKREHLWTKGILTVTVIVLIAFFVSVSVHNFSQSLVAAFMMTSVLLIRIYLEYISWNRYRKLDESKSFNVYTKQISAFYEWRKKIHFLCTPILILLYIFGFVLLLPFFKSGLSEGFYTYIKVSGIVVFLSLSIIIFRQIKKELKMLRFLKNVFDKH